MNEPLGPSPAAEPQGSTGPAGGRGYLLLAFLTVTWGLGWPIMKVALGEVPLWSFRTLCLGVGGVAILVMGRMSGRPLAIPPQDRWPLLWVSLINVTGWNLFSAYGILLMEAGRAVIIAYTMPLWAAILGRIFLGEYLTPGRILGLLLGLAGMAVLMGPDLRAMSTAPLGALCMLAASLSWAGGTVMIKRVRWSLSTSMFTGWQLILGGLPIFMGAILLEPDVSALQLTWAGGLATAYVVVIGVILGYWGWVKVVQMFPVSVSSLGTLAVPVIGVFSSAFTLGETVTGWEIAALGLVVAGLASILERPRRSLRKDR